MKYLILLISLLSTQTMLVGQLNIDKSSFDKSINNFDVDNSLIIIGEAHEVKGTYSTELFIIKELLKKGKTTILIEDGISGALILNEYLKTKNKDILNSTRAIGENYRKLIEGIESISTDSEIRFKGVDFERSMCLEYIFNKWFSKLNNPKLNEIKKEALSIKRNTSPKKIKRKILKIREAYTQCENELKKELGKDFNNLRSIIFNPVFEADFRVSSKKRDKGIIDNILSIEKAELRKSILIFGSNHFTHKNHFGPKLGEKMKQEISCIPFIFAYKNCTNYLKKKNYSSIKPLSNYIENEGNESKISFQIEKSKLLSPLDKTNRLILVKILNQ